MAAEFENEFARALRDPAEPVPASVLGAGGAAPKGRFDVYRNNFVAGLMKALRQRFPATAKIVGEEFFAGMAQAFVAQAPPRTPIVAMYGDAFADFVAAFEPAREVAYVADVARLEAARTRAYHAADAVPLDVAAFAALDPDRLGGIGIGLHPSTEIVRSAHPVVTIWAMNSGERELAPIADWQPEDALVARPRLEVEVRLLPPGGAAFLLALAAAEPLAAATEKALDEDPQFDLSHNLASLIGWGLACSILVATS